MSPAKALIKEKFQVLEISLRVNMMGSGSSYRSIQFNLFTGMVVTTALSALYYVFALKIAPAQGLNMVLIPIAVYSSFSVLFFLMGILGNERLWLGFLALSPTRYLKTIIALKALAFAVLLLPIAIANFILAFEGHSGALTFGLILLIFLPSFLIIMIYISVFLSPVQIKEELTMGSQFTLRQMDMVFPLIAITLLTVAGILSIIACIAGVIIMVAISLILLNSRKVSNAVLQKLLENGFE